MKFIGAINQFLHLHLLFFNKQQDWASKSQPKRQIAQRKKNWYYKAMNETF